MKTVSAKSLANLRPMGRPKGCRNKTTTSIKEAVTITFDRLGGAKGLIDWTQKHPRNLTAFYTLIWPRLIPKEVNLDATITHDIAARLLQARNQALELSQPKNTMEIDHKGHILTPSELIIQEAIEDNETINSLRDPEKVFV